MVAPACLIESQYAPSSQTALYTVQTGSAAIIDKFVAQNSSGGAVTLTVSLVPNGQSQGAANIIVNAQSLAAGANLDVTILQNNILALGDSISVAASSASAIVVRASGRTYP
jgi:hypothetical protein